MTLIGKTILITSNEPWGDIWYSKQNYAYELSKHNTVFFLNPPTKWSPLRLFSFNVQETSINENLSVVSYDHILPYLGDFANRANDALISKKLKNHFASKGISDFVFWSFDPIRLYSPQKLGAQVSVFHCVDYFYFKHLGERALCTNSDLIFGTSQLFLNNYQDFNAPKHLVPHGISSEEFSLNPEEKLDHKLPFENFGLYIGVIDHRMDFEAFESVIQSFPETPFVFIGPIRDQPSEGFKRIFIDKLYSNVHSIGPKHFKTLKYYVDQASFCLSLMDMSFHMNTVHHHKTLVYLNQGKPVFSFMFEEYKSNEDIMYLSNNVTELTRSLKELIDHGEALDLKEKRVEYAKQFTFENILKNAGQIIEDFQLSNAKESDD